ncbi:hypothetical protein TIFTF001_030086 [Ficus carica]|uniref:RING-type domain-containing protein n=1 Tax=Ficus carica TaxID=3494 RepID=A0AA88DT46_FICCA|nr:hypothetical protein TIFTF001_030086 [Ficus carica]
MASNSTSSTSQEDEDLSQTAYIAIFSLGSLALVLLVTAVCCLFRNEFRSFSTTTAEQPADRKQGLDDSLIGNYPKLLFSQVKLNSRDDDQVSNSCCSICLTDYVDDDMVLLLPDCGHFFHVKCVDEWLRMNSTCPVCRNPLSQVSVSVSIPQDPC